MDTIIHRAESRGFADYGWLQTKYSFSFARYYNPDRMGFGLLRVLNDDIIAPGKGFGTHPHDNMEIITIPLSGALEHEDSGGHKQSIHSDEVQIMSAGSGVTHSEYNHSRDEDVSLLQIWILPDKKNINPRYDQMKFDPSTSRNRILTLVSPDKSPDTLWINQNARISRVTLDPVNAIVYEAMGTDRAVYLFVIDGNIEINSMALKPRDGIGIKESSKVEFHAQAESDILIIDVPDMTGLSE
ncbi:MAG: pirin family protein [Calditrichaceae bacterium]